MSSPMMCACHTFCYRAVWHRVGVVMCVVMWIMLVLHTGSFGQSLAETELSATRSAEQHTIDSLHSLLNKATTTKDRVRLLNDVAWQYRNVDIPKALAYAKQAREESARHKLYAEEAQALNYQGVAYRNMGDAARAFESFAAAQNLASKQTIPVQLAYAYNNMGDIYRQQTKYAEALANISKARDIFVNIGDPRGEAYSELRMGEVYQAQKRYAQALEHFQRALVLREQLRDTVQIATVNLRIARLYQTQGMYEKASLILQNLERSSRLYNERLNAELNLVAAELATATGRTEASLDNALKALHLAELTDSKQQIEQAALLLSQSLAALGRFQDAYKYHQIYVNIVVQLRNQEVERKIAATESRYAVEQAELKLQQEQRLSAFIAIGGTLLVMLIAALAVTFFRHGREQEVLNAALRQKNSALEETSRQLAQANEEIQQQLSVQSQQAAELEEFTVEVQERNIALEAAMMKVGEMNKEIRRQSAEIEERMRIQAEQSAEIERFTLEVQERNIALESAMRKVGEMNNHIREQNERLEQTLSELRETQAQLVQSERMNVAGMLTAGVMHEINNPNAAVYAALSSIEQSVKSLETYFLSLLDEESRASEEAQEFCSKIASTQAMITIAIEGAKRVKNIVSNLQNFTKHQREGVYIGSLADEIRTTIDIFRYQFKDIEVRTSFDSKLSMKAQFGEINQVFMNLFVNAVQAGATTLAIEGKRVNDAVIVTVTDNGKGMSEATQARIFEPFFTTKGVSNSGLGLSISKTILERNGGTITVASQLGEGTTFTMRFAQE